MTTFTLSHKVQCYQSQMEWEKVKNFHPSGVVFSPPSPPRFSLASVVLRPLLAELRTPPSLALPWSRGPELRTPFSWEEELVAQDDDGHGYLVLMHIATHQSTMMLAINNLDLFSCCQVVCLVLINLEHLIVVVNFVRFFRFCQF